MLGVVSISCYYNSVIRRQTKKIHISRKLSFVYLAGPTLEQLTFNTWFSRSLTYKENRRGNKISLYQTPVLQRKVDGVGLFIFCTLTPDCFNNSKEFAIYIIIL